MTRTLERLERLTAEGDTDAEAALRREHLRRGGLTEAYWAGACGDGGRTRYADVAPVEEAPEVIWRRSLDVDQPLLVAPNGAVLACTPKGVLELDPDGGETRRTLSSDAPFSRAAFTGGRLVGRTPEGLMGLEWQSGERLWELPVSSLDDFAVGGSRLLVHAGERVKAYDIAGEGELGEPLWDQFMRSRFGGPGPRLSRCGTRAWVGGAMVDGASGEAMVDVPGDSVVLDGAGAASIERPVLRLWDADGGLQIDTADPNYNGHINGDYRKTLVHGQAPRGLSPTHLVSARLTISRSSGHYDSHLQSWPRRGGGLTTLITDAWNPTLLAVVRDVVVYEHLGITASRISGGEPLWTWKDPLARIRDVAIGPRRIFARARDEIIALGS